MILFFHVVLIVLVVVIDFLLGDYFWIICRVVVLQYIIEQEIETDSVSLVSKK